MSKRGKRIIWTVALLLTAFVLGYLIFSSNNLRDRQVPWPELDGGLFLNRNAEKELTLQGERAALRIGEEIYQLTVRKYEGGVLVVGADEDEFVFSVQAPERLYCGRLNAYLYRM